MWAILAIIILGILLMLILRNERQKELLRRQEHERRQERARIEKLVETFMRTVLPDPEKTGEQLGSWVLSRLGTKRK